MKVFRFDAGTGRPIDRFDSVNVVLSRIGRLDGSVQMGCFHLGPGGVIGYHQATMPQLFLVVQGAGWVRGEGPERRPIAPGQAAFWTGGEWHESGSETGMTAVVVESEALAPDVFMPEA